MVAISLYRGNLHRVSDVPRRWFMPTPQISLKDFRILLSRRNRALSQHRSSTTAATSSNPNPNPNPSPYPNSNSEEKNGAWKDVPDASNHETGANSEKVAADWGEGPSGDTKEKEEKPNLDGALVKPIDGSDSLPAPNKSNEPEPGSDPVDHGAKPQDVERQKVDELADPNSEV